MPKELESVFIGSLNLDAQKFTDMSAQRQQMLRSKLKELDEETAGNT
jgi:hypothetical protein